MAPPAGPPAISASPRVHALLARLHAASESQEKSISQIWFYLKRLAAFYLFSSAWGSTADDHMRDKFVALEQDKCHFMYLLARNSGALNIVEAGTSFGVSTIYLALAVGQNVAAQKAQGKSVSGKVVATEKEPSKAARAREHWAEAGDEVAGIIELREGDLLETLQMDGMPEQVDMLLLDSTCLARSFRGPGWGTRTERLTRRSLDSDGPPHAQDHPASVEKGCHGARRQY